MTDPANLGRLPSVVLYNFLQFPEQAFSQQNRSQAGENRSQAGENRSQAGESTQQRIRTPSTTNVLQHPHPTDVEIHCSKERKRGRPRTSVNVTTQDVIMDQDDSDIQLKTEPSNDAPFGSTNHSLGVSQRPQEQSASEDYLRGPSMNGAESGGLRISDVSTIDQQPRDPVGLNDSLDSGMIIKTEPLTDHFTVHDLPVIIDAVSVVPRIDSSTGEQSGSQDMLINAGVSVGEQALQERADGRETHERGQKESRSVTTADDGKSVVSVEVFSASDDDNFMFDDLDHGTKETSDVVTITRPVLGPKSKKFERKAGKVKRMAQKTGVKEKCSHSIVKKADKTSTPSSFSYLKRSLKSVPHTVYLADETPTLLNSVGLCRVSSSTKQDTSTLKLAIPKLAISSLVTAAEPGPSTPKLTVQEPGTAAPPTHQLIAPVSTGILPTAHKLTARKLTTLKPKSHKVATARKSTAPMPTIVPKPTFQKKTARKSTAPKANTRKVSVPKSLTPKLVNPKKVERESGTAKAPAPKLTARKSAAAKPTRPKMTSLKSHVSSEAKLSSSEVSAKSDLLSKKQRKAYCTPCDVYLENFSKLLPHSKTRAHMKAAEKFKHTIGKQEVNKDHKDKSCGVATAKDVSPQNVVNALVNDIEGVKPPAGATMCDKCGGSVNKADTGSDGPSCQCQQSGKTIGNDGLGQDSLADVVTENSSKGAAENTASSGDDDALGWLDDGFNDYDDYEGGDGDVAGAGYDDDTEVEDAERTGKGYDEATDVRDEDEAGGERKHSGDKTSDTKDAVIRRKKTKPKATSVSKKKADPGASQQQKPFVCQQCGRGYIYKFGLLRHRRGSPACQLQPPKEAATSDNDAVKSRIKKNEKTFKCPVCPKEYYSLYPLQYHMETVDHVWKCEKCARWVHETDRASHTEQICQESKPVEVVDDKELIRATCPICKIYTNSSRKVLSTHMAANHSKVGEDGSVVCALCESVLEDANTAGHMLKCRKLKEILASQRPDTAIENTEAAAVEAAIANAVADGSAYDAGKIQRRSAMQASVMLKEDTGSEHASESDEADWAKDWLDVEEKAAALSDNDELQVKAEPGCKAENSGSTFGVKRRRNRKKNKKVENVLSEFACLVCRRDFSSLKSIKRHNNRVGHVWRCIKCAQWFKETQRSRHNEEACMGAPSSDITVAQAPANTCRICLLYSSKWPRNMIKHVASNHETRGADGFTQCPCCAEVLDNEEFGFIKHLMHSCKNINWTTPLIQSEKNDVCSDEGADEEDTGGTQECKVCQKTFPSNLKLRRHLRLVGHVWKCQKCDCWFEEEKRADHNEEECQGQPSSAVVSVASLPVGTCTVCRIYQNNSRHRLCTHMASNHEVSNSGGSVVCPLCLEILDGVTTTFKHLYWKCGKLDHMTQDVPYQSSKTALFEASEAAKTIKRLVPLEIGAMNLMCPICRIKFDEESKLISHLEDLHVFQCGECELWQKGYDAHIAHIKDCKHEATAANVAQGEQAGSAQGLRASNPLQSHEIGNSLQSNECGSTFQSQMGALQSLVNNVSPHKTAGALGDDLDALLLSLGSRPSAGAGFPPYAEAGQPLSDQTTAADGKSYHTLGPAQYNPPLSTPVASDYSHTGGLPSIRNLSRPVVPYNRLSRTPTALQDDPVEDTSSEHLLNQLVEARVTDKICPICHEGCTEHSTFDLHLRENHLLSCDKCEKSLRSIAAFTDHLMSCKGSLAPTILCKICKVYTVGNGRRTGFQLNELHAELAQHMEYNHMKLASDMGRSCPICQARLFSTQSLRAHFLRDACNVNLVTTHRPYTTKRPSYARSAAFPATPPKRSRFEENWFNHLKTGDERIDGEPENNASRYNEDQSTDINSDNDTDVDVENDSNSGALNIIDVKLEQSATNITNSTVRRKTSKKNRGPKEEMYRLPGVLTEQQYKNLTLLELYKPTHPCPVCNHMLPRELYRAHVSKRHTQVVRPGEEQCRECLYVTDKGQTIQDHMRMDKCIRRYHCCPDCPLIFSRYIAYAHHRNTNHVEADQRIPKFICRTCGSGFFAKPKFLAHNREHKSGTVNAREETLHKCMVCEERFSHPRYRAIHEEARHCPGGKCYVTGCTFALGQYKNWTIGRFKIQLHLQRNHGVELAARFPCPHSCPRFFNTENELAQHVTRIHDEAVRQCPSCPYVSTGKLAQIKMHVHRNAYHTETSYNCDQCSFSCKWRASLSRHKTTIHSGGEKKHECMICGMKFTQGGSVMRHMRVAHKEQLC